MPTKTLLPWQQLHRPISTEISVPISIGGPASANRIHMIKLNQDHSQQFILINMSFVRIVCSWPEGHVSCYYLWQLMKTLHIFKYVLMFSGINGLETLDEITIWYICDVHVLVCTTKTSWLYAWHCCTTT